MEEQRQLPRWEIKKEAKVWLPDMLGFSHCIIENMHLKGMRASFDRPLPQQGFLRMSFEIADNAEPIKIEATIPWEKQEQGRYVYGLSFNNISDEDKNRIYQYTSSHCYEQFKHKWWE
jgi:hypothetical protein